MRYTLLLFFAFLAIITQSCGTDRQSDAPSADQTELQHIDGIHATTATIDIDELLLNGKTFETPFTLDSALPLATIVFKDAGTTIESSLRVDGFDGPLQSLAIMGVIGDTSQSVLLHIRKDGIFDGRGNRLVEQVPAKYGYAWRVGTSSTEALLSRRSFISVLLLDENGAGVSDELYIYWMTSNDNNGTFVVTNIPNEIM
jgi:hypothetical protein